jgi:hypothetical protein
MLRKEYGDGTEDNQLKTLCFNQHRQPTGLRINTQYWDPRSPNFGKKWQRLAGEKS